MRKKPMNFCLIFALGGIALLAIIGAVQAVRWVCFLLAVALAYWGGWDSAEAMQAAPWIIVVSTAGLAMSLYGMHEVYSAAADGLLTALHDADDVAHG